MMRRDYYTISYRAVMTYIGWQIQEHGKCDDPYPKIGSKVGVSETTVKDAMNLARHLGDVNIEYRPRSGRKHLPNIIAAKSPRWKSWLKHSTKNPGLEGQNFDPDQVKDKRVLSKEREARPEPKPEAPTATAAASGEAAGLAMIEAGENPSPEPRDRRSQESKDEIAALVAAFRARPEPEIPNPVRRRVA